MKKWLILLLILTLLPAAALAESDLSPIVATIDLAALENGAQTEDGMPSYCVIDEHNQALHIFLPANPTTGYTWSYELDNDLIAFVTEIYIHNGAEGAVGAGGVWHAVFQTTMKGVGDVTLTLRYARPWEDTPPIEEHTLRLWVVENGDLDFGAAE